jgi:uncharacterized membrane protein YcaP (DUF421 family)
MAVDAVLRAVVMYLFLLVVFRIAGKRSLAELTTFDFLLLLILSETTQQAMVGNDHSMTNAFLLVITWLSVDIALSVVKQRFPRAEKWLEGVPVVIVADGRPLHDRMERLRVDEDDVLTAARRLHGLERLDQIKYAVLERSGGISVIPRSGPASPPSDAHRVRV